MAKKKQSKSAKPAAAKSAAKVTSEPFLVSHGAAPAKAAVSAPRVPTTDEVSARAHQIWIARGKPTPGTPLADWLQAERELGVRKS